MITSLNLIGCASLPSWIPARPEVVQYGYHPDIEPPGFYGVSTKDKKKRSFEPQDSMAMKGAQCLSPTDYKKAEAWVKDTIKAVRENCK